MKTQICHKVKFDLKGHPRSLLCKKKSRTFVYGPILIKICINANIMKTHFFNKIIHDLKCYFYVMEKFCNLFTLKGL